MWIPFRCRREDEKIRYMAEDMVSELAVSGEQVRKVPAVSHPIDFLSA